MPLWMFVLAAVWAVVATGLFVAARSDGDAAVAAVPDLGALADEHLAGLGVVEESGEDQVSATFYGVGLDELEGLLDELGFSPAVMNRIGNTRALDGTQTAQTAHVTATWTYHPDDGLSIVLERSAS